jgi:hypothetical protein
METRKKSKQVEVQFVSNHVVGREIVSIKDTKVKKIGTIVNTNYSRAYALTPLLCYLSCDYEAIKKL